MQIAVVILNWNGQKLLEKFLPTVIKYSTNATIYVADNASTDNSVAYIQDNFPTVHIIQNTINGGYALGYNQALTQVNEDILCLLNSDVEVTQNWLVPILQLFKADEQVAIVQPKILDYNQKEYFEYAGAAGGFIDKYGYPFCRGRVFDTLEKDEGQYNNEQEIFWASGACLFIRNNDFKNEQGFDEDFFAHMEEIDLCWRIKNSGKKIMFTPKSIVYHVGGGTLHKINPRKTFLNFRNSLFTLLKNLPEKQMKGIIFKRMLLDGLAFIKFTISFKFSHAFAILKAHKSYYQLKASMLKKRSANVKAKNYYYCVSIVGAYYLKRVKQFRNLI